MDALELHLDHIEKSLALAVVEMKLKNGPLSSEHVRRVREIESRIKEIRSIDTYNQVKSGVKLKDLDANWKQE